MNNKDLQLCAIGNGLLDIQAGISDEEISQLGIAKGEMRLVDSSFQQEIINKLGNRKLHKSSGGSAANSIIAFSQFGGKAAYNTLLGNDEYGNFYHNEFKELGIEINNHKLQNIPTGTCLVLITPDSERSMLTCLSASSHLSKEHINEDLIKRSEWLYIEGYCYSQQNTADAVDYSIEISKKYNTKIAVTFSDVFIVNLFKENLSKTIENAELLFCNEIEAKAYTGTDNSEDAFEELCKICPNVVLTLGSIGSKIKWDGHVYNIESFKTTPVDTTGAGDMFAGAFFYGILNNGNPEYAGRLASLASSRIVSTYGARYKGNIKEIIEII
jgi:sugar/nucleoside kinase (ribokinase family)